MSLCHKLERNWVFATNSDILIPISLEPNDVDLWYCKDIGIRQFAFVAKTQFLSNSKSLKPDGINFWYFKLRLFDLTKFIVWNIIGIRKLEFVEKN